jgi:hypothetical protein
MDKLNPRPGVVVPGVVEPEENIKGDRVEHARIGFMEFAARHEQLVREKNAKIEVLEIEKENCWRDYLADNLEVMTNAHKADVAEAFKEGLATSRWGWLLTGALVGLLAEWGLLTHGYTIVRFLHNL